MICKDMYHFSNYLSIIKEQNSIQDLIHPYYSYNNYNQNILRAKNEF